MPTNKCPLCKGTGKSERGLNSRMQNDRKKLGISLRAAGAMADISHSQLRSMENGVVDWDPHVLNSLQEYYRHERG